MHEIRVRYSEWELRHCSAWRVHLKRLEAPAHDCSSEALRTQYHKYKTT